MSPWHLKTKRKAEVIMEHLGIYVPTLYLLPFFTPSHTHTHTHLFCILYPDLSWLNLFSSEQINISLVCHVIWYCLIYCYVFQCIFLAIVIIDFLNLVDCGVTPEDGTGVWAHILCALPRTLSFCILQVNEVMGRDLTWRHTYNMLIILLKLQWIPTILYFTKS